MPYIVPLKCRCPINNHDHIKTNLRLPPLLWTRNLKQSQRATWEWAYLPQVKGNLIKIATISKLMLGNLHQSSVSKRARKLLIKRIACMILMNVLRLLLPNSSSEDPKRLFSVRLTICIRSFDDALDLLFWVIVIKKTLETSLYTTQS